MRTIGLEIKKPKPKPAPQDEKNENFKEWYYAMLCRLSIL